MKNPCKDCITFPICKSESQEILKRFNELPFSAFRVYQFLENKCCLLHDYVWFVDSRSIIEIIEEIFK